VIVELLEDDFEGNVTDTPHDSPVGSRDEGSNLISFPSIRISIEDTGIGLSEETRKTLFQPFRQAQRMAGGTGLGLFSLSKRMEALGGSRGVSKRRDGTPGSNFWFSFPYRPDWTTHELQKEIEDLSDQSGLFDKGSVRSIISCEEDSSIKMFHRSLNVMLIDDSLTILNVVSRSLRKNGYNFITASNGSAGLDRLIEGHEKDEFDFVLMDLQMPVMDGIEAVTRYREFEQVSGEIALQTRLPIIGMSANSDNTTKQCALKCGMDLFIPKPFILAELESLLHQLLTKMQYGNPKSETVDSRRDSCKSETV
jgi:CheY-like chemotaxis protein